MSAWPKDAYGRAANAISVDLYYAPTGEGTVPQWGVFIAGQIFTTKGAGDVVELIVQQIKSAEARNAAIAKEEVRRR